MFYLSIYFIIFFIFSNDIFGFSRKKSDVILKLHNRKLKNKKNKIKKKLVRSISDSKEIVSVDNRLLSDVIACLFSEEVKYGHIFAYFKHFLNTVLNKNEKINELLVNFLSSDIDIFIKLLKTIIGNNKKIDITKIKDYFFENDKAFYELYFHSNKAYYLNKNSYVIDINPDLLLKIHYFFKNNNIEGILKNIELKKNLDDNQEAIFSYYKFQQVLINNNILFSNRKLKDNDIAMRKINNNLIEKDSNAYLYELIENIEDYSLFQKAITTYLYFLLLKAEIIPISLLQDTIKQTTLDQKDIVKNFKKINEALKSSENIISNLWKIVSNNKEIFFDSDEYIYIEKIDNIGGMSQYLKKIIMQEKSKNLFTVEKAKSYLPAILKVVGTGILIAGGIYATNSILGGHFIKKSIDGIGGLIDRTKDTIFSWFKDRSSNEILYKAATTNFIEQALLNSSRGLINTIEEKTKSILPVWFSKGVGAFISGIGILALKQEASMVMTEKVLQPIAKTLGFHGVDTNFSFYKYAKNKISDYFTSIKMYYQYDISENIINESLLIQKLFEYQKNMQRVIVAVNSNENKYLKRFESALQDKFQEEFSRDEHIRNVNRVIEERVSQELKNREK